MSAKDLLEFQVNGSFAMLAERIDATTEPEWTRRAFPGTNLVGFILWHGARTIDWTVHTAIRGVPEVADQAPWKGRLAQQAAFGAGVPAEEADAVARDVGRDAVRAYLAEVRGAVMGWLRGLTDGDLERVPDFKEHQRGHPRYLEPSIWAEVDTFVRLPAWQILARPAVAHIRVHSGEIDTLLQAIRMAR